MKPSDAGLSLLGIFFFIINSFSLVVICSDCLFLPDSVLTGCMFLDICSFLLGCSICWHITIYSTVLWFFVTLWYQLLLLLFNSFSFLVLSHFLLMNLAIVYEFCLSFQKISSWFRWSFCFCFYAANLFISSLFFILFFLLVTLGFVCYSFSNSFIW